jgi:Gpi18-like mannosyltransferase
VKNWDGPNFLVVAKSLYDPQIIKKLLFISQDSKYFAAHFPLFPLILRLITPIFGWFYSGFVLNLFFGFLTNLLFYQLAKKYTKKPLFLTFVFTVFPARYWIVRSVISPETMMLFFILLSLWMWEEKRYVSSSVAGAVGVLTKFQTIFLFPAFVATEIEQWYKEKKMPPLYTLSALLIPLSYVALSIFFLVQFGDFNAYLHAERNNNLFIYFPFGQFNHNNTWIGTAWLEDIVFYIVAMAVLIFTLFKSKQRLWFYFTLFYAVFLFFLPHRDIARYAMQLQPLFLLTFAHFFTSKPFKYGLILSMPALYFYAINFIMTNQAPIEDWSHFLK